MNSKYFFYRDLTVFHFFNNASKLPQPNKLFRACFFSDTLISSLHRRNSALLLFRLSEGLESSILKTTSHFKIISSKLINIILELQFLYLVNFKCKWKSRKVHSATLLLFFNVLSENVILFHKMWLFLQKKNIVNVRKTCFYLFFSKRGCLTMRNWAEIFHAININVQFNTLT